MAEAQFFGLPDGSPGAEPDQAAALRAAASRVQRLAQAVSTFPSTATSQQTCQIANDVAHSAVNIPATSYHGPIMHLVACPSSQHLPRGKFSMFLQRSSRQNGAGPLILLGFVL